MIEDRMFEYWMKYLSEDFLNAFRSTLKSIAEDPHYSKSSDMYNIWNIVFALECIDITTSMEYLLNKYGAEFVDYIQGMLVLWD